MPPDEIYGRGSRREEEIRNPEHHFNVSNNEERVMVEVKESAKAKAEAPQGQAKGTAKPAEIEARKPEQAARGISPLAGRGGSPFALIRRFAEEMDRLIEDFGVGRGLQLPSLITRGHELLRRETGLIEAEWSPQIDVKEQDGQCLVHADLPGMNKEDIKVEVNANLLTIQGERKKKEAREGYSYSECSYGHFYRAIPLPQGTDTSKVSAEFQDGVLEIAIPIPSHPEPQARRVEVREKK